MNNKICTNSLLLCSGCSDLPTVSIQTDCLPVLFLSDRCYTQQAKNGFNTFQNILLSLTLLDNSASVNNNGYLSKKRLSYGLSKTMT